MRRLPIPTLVALVLCIGASVAAWYGYETRPYQDNQRNWLHPMAGPPRCCRRCWRCGWR